MGPARHGVGGLAAGPTARGGVVCWVVARRPLRAERMAWRRARCQVRARGRGRVVRDSWARCVPWPLVGQWEFLACWGVGPPYPPRTGPGLGGSTPGRPAGAYPQGMVTGASTARTGTQRASATNVPGTRDGPCAQRNAPCARAASPMTIYVARESGLVIQRCHGRDGTAQRTRRDTDR